MPHDDGESLFMPDWSVERVVGDDGDNHADHPIHSRDTSRLSSVVTTTTEGLNDEDDEVQYLGQNRVQCMGQNVSRRFQLVHSGIVSFAGQEYENIQQELHRILGSSLACLKGDQSTTAREIRINLRHDEAGVLNMLREDMNNSIETHYKPNLTAAFDYMHKQFRQAQNHHDKQLTRKEDRAEYARGVLARHEERYLEMKGNGRQALRLQKDLLLVRD